MVYITICPEPAAQKLTGVMKCPIPWQVAFSNSTVTFDISVWNPSYFYDTLKIDIKDPDLPEGWKSYFLFQDKKVREIYYDG